MSPDLNLGFGLGTGGPTSSQYPARNHSTSSSAGSDIAYHSSPSNLHHPSQFGRLSLNTGNMATFTCTFESTCYTYDTVSTSSPSSTTTTTISPTAAPAATPTTPTTTTSTTADNRPKHTTHDNMEIGGIDINLEESLGLDNDQERRGSFHHHNHHHHNLLDSGGLGSIMGIDDIPMSMPSIPLSSTNSTNINHIIHEFDHGGLMRDEISRNRIMDGDDEIKFDVDVVVRSSHSELSRMLFEDDDDEGFLEVSRGAFKIE
ncbi:hypothetical protein HDU76_001684 [Blyttiomyces sp. JEL0837]|nr:hypothetical protein HDU76_001684 [Blyttiomyces sp. JEL0837]